MRSIVSTQARGVPAIAGYHTTGAIVGNRESDRKGKASYRESDNEDHMVRDERAAQSVAFKLRVIFPKRCLGERLTLITVVTKQPAYWIQFGGR